VNYKKIVLFLLIAFGISWLSAGALYISGISYGSGLSVAIIAVFFMMAPAAAAFIVQKSIYKNPVKDLGLDLKKTRWKAMLWIPVIQLMFCLIYALVIYILGNVLGIDEFGFYSFDQGLLDNRMEEIILASGAVGAPKVSIPPVVLFLITIITSILLGAIVNGIFTFGEELGWRGFLYNETKKLGYFKSNLLIGVIWGIWHAPIIIQGHNYPEHPVEGVFMMMMFCIPVSFIMSWLRLKTNSVLGPTFFHGMINASGSGLMMLSYEYNDLVGSIAGLAGVITTSVIAISIVILDRKTISRSSLNEEQVDLVQSQ
jgi:membrane protease YdiL (CAAX protease family)